MNEHFRKFARWSADISGSAGAFTLAVLAVVLWLAFGPIYRYSDTWQLVINTATTVVTFVMVFLIQSTQNRDSRALHLKIDELLKAVHDARTGLVDLEHASDQELERLESEFKRLHERLTKTSDAVSSPKQA